MKTSQSPSSPSRRQLLGTALALSSLPGAALATSTDMPSAGTANTDPATADLGARLDQLVQSGAAPNLHAVCVMRKGALVLERYYQGNDERWGTPLGTVSHQADTRHDLRSVTKSIVGLLYGIALGEGKVPALDTPVVAAFPAYAGLAGDPSRRRIRMSDVLSMTMGLDWNEDLPYSDPRNSEIAMEHSADRYRYVLGRPIVAEPGTAWRYSGGATALLGHLIAQGSGMSLEAFARSRLFAPLGIEDVEWVPGLNGEAAAASGLRMRAPDLARVGLLVMQRGQWDGRSVVPADWIAASLTRRADAFDGVKYGYHWYLAQQRDGSSMTMAIGWGGQRLVVARRRTWCTSCSWATTAARPWRSSRPCLRCRVPFTLHCAECGQMVCSAAPARSTQGMARHCAARSGGTGLRGAHGLLLMIFKTKKPVNAVLTGFFAIQNKLNSAPGAMR